MRQFDWPEKLFYRDRDTSETGSREVSGRGTGTGRTQGREIRRPDGHQGQGRRDIPGDRDKKPKGLGPEDKETGDRETAGAGNREPGGLRTGHYASTYVLQTVRTGGRYSSGARNREPGEEAGNNEKRGRLL